MIHRPHTHRAGFRRCIRLMVLAFIMNPAPAIGQQTESFEGFVRGIRANAVAGEVIYQRKDGKFDLEAGLTLATGDFIRSSANAYAEVLLQPGNYLRIGENTECQILSDEHDRILIRLNRGAMSLEILSHELEGSLSFFDSLIDRYALIRVLTPNAEVFIIQPGIFRINASEGDRTELVPRKGEAAMNGRRVKEKRRAVAFRREVTIAELDSNVEDAFDLWARERANKLVQANRMLKKESPWSKKQKEGQETSVDLPADEAQSSGYVISAKPGAVSFVETGVELNRPGKDWRQPAEKSQLEAGDKLRTSTESFAELSILPDIYLRLSHESEILFEQLSNEAIHLKLLRGSAILDVARFDRKQLPPILFAGPLTSTVIAKEGNYRIDAATNSDQVTVREGKVILNERSVGACRRISGAEVSDCDKKRIDNFDYWSQHRGEGETFAWRSTVAMASYLARIRRARSRNTGFWYQHPGQVHYTFVPFTSQNFRSPYGGNYSTVLAPRRNVPLNRVDSSRRPSIRSGPMRAQPIP